jgi:CRP-like cAMP-binding protein
VPGSTSIRPGDQVQRLLLLRTFEAFRDLSPVELAAVAEHVRPRRFRKGAQLFELGSVVRSNHFVVEGKVAIVREGKQVRVFGPQSSLGGLASLTGEPESQIYLAIEDTETLELLRDDIQDVFEDNFRIFQGVMRAITRVVLEVRRKLGPSAGFPPVTNADPVRPIGEMGLVEKVFFLRRTMSFAQTRIEALADLAQEAEDLTLPAGQILWRAGDVSDHALMLISGIIACETDDRKQSFKFDPGSTVGGIDALASVPRWYEARAETPIRTLRVDAQRLLDVIEDNIELGMDMLRVFGLGLRQLQALEYENKLREGTAPAAE